MRKFVCTLLIWGIATALPGQGGHAQGQPFFGPQLSEGGGRNSLSYQDIFDSRGQYLTYYRGVLLQAIAGFRENSGGTVQASQAKIEIGTNKEICLKIGGDSCLSFQLPTDQVRALMRFIKAGKYGAFTAPWSSKEPDSIVAHIKSVMVLTRDGKNWIASELNTPEFERIFSYIDFNRPYPFVNANFGRDRAEATTTEINIALGNKEFIGQLTSKEAISAMVRNSKDGTYLNTDLNANFIARGFADSVVCEGLPARLFWVLPADRQFPLLARIQYAAPEFVNDQHRKYYVDAQAVFCTTAILRALFSARSPSLVRLE